MQLHALVTLLPLALGLLAVRLEDCSELKEFDFGGFMQGDAALPKPLMPRQIQRLRQRSQVSADAALHLLV